MSKLRFLRQPSFDRLLVNVDANRKRYQQDDPWLDDYFGSSSYFAESDIEWADHMELVLPEGVQRQSDLENTKSVYSALRHLSPAQAADPRIWAYMTHVSHWQYMRARWPSESYESPGTKFAENVRAHYLFSADSSRALVRNGLARLWWYGYTSYDEDRADPFELTAVLLKTQDVARSVMEMAFSRSAKVTKALLVTLHEFELNGQPFYERSRIREVVRYLWQIGGVIVVDALGENEIRRLVQVKISEVSR